MDWWVELLIISIANLKFFSEMFTLSKLFATMHSNKRQMVSSFHGEDHGPFWGVSGHASV